MQTEPHFTQAFLNAHERHMLTRLTVEKHIFIDKEFYEYIQNKEWYKKIEKRIKAVKLQGKQVSIQYRGTPEELLNCVNDDSMQVQII